MTVTLNRQQDVRVTTANGVIHRDEVLRVYQEIVADPRLSVVTRALVDLREASLEALTAEDIRAYTNLPSLPRQKETRMAIVAGDPVSFGMSRMYAMLHETSLAGEVDVFYDYDVAMAWLFAKRSDA